MGANSLRLSRIGAFQDRIYILDFGRLLDTVIGTFRLFNEGIGLDFQTPIAV